MRVWPVKFRSESEDWEEVNGVGGVEKRRKCILVCEIVPGLIGDEGDRVDGVGVPGEEMKERR